MKEFRVLLADDQELIRESLHIVLEMEPDLEIAGMAENGRAAVELCASVMPDVVLMDIRMPEMDGVEATRRIKERWPHVRVIILTTFQEVQYVVDALTVGAEGYLLKAIHPKDLAAGIRLVCRGGSLIPQEVARLLIRNLQPPAPPQTSLPAQPEPAPAKALPYGLSERELQVLHCLSDGMTNRDIAQCLHLSEGTIKNYISHIYSKLDVRDRFQAALKAQKEGMI